MSQRKRRSVKVNLSRCIWGIGMIAGLGLVSCEPQTPVSEEGELPLAQIGEEVIRLEDFKRFIAGLPEWTKSEQAGSEKVRDYLQTLVDRALILHAAAEKGVTQSAQVEDALALALEQRLVQEVEKREIKADIRVEEQEVRAAYEERGWGRRLKVAHIFVRSDEELEKVMAELQAGTDFGDVARAYSQDPPSVEHGGEKPYYYSRNNATPEVRDILFRLQVGQRSAPIPISKGYEIFLVLDEVEASFEEMGEKVHQELHQERLGVVRQEYFGALEERHDLRPEPQGLSVLLGALRRNEGKKAFHYSANEASVVLFSYAGGDITLDEAVERASSLRRGRGVDDSLRIVEAVKREVAWARLLALRGVELGIDQEPDMRAWLERKKDDIIIRQMRRLMLGQQAVVSEEEVQQYYAENKQRYLTARKVEVIAVQLSSQGEAEAVLGEIERDLTAAGELVARVEQLKEKLAAEQAIGTEMRALSQLSAGPKVYGWLQERLKRDEDRGAVLEEISGATSARDLVQTYIVQYLALTRSLRPDDGRLQLHRFDSPNYGPLSDAAMEAEVGDLIGPFEHEGLYSVAKVVAHDEPQIRSLADVARGIAGKLRSRKEDEIFDKWLVQLRDHYKGEVEYFPENIAVLGAQ